MRAPWHQLFRLRRRLGGEHRRQCPRRLRGKRWLGGECQRRWPRRLRGECQLHVEHLALSPRWPRSGAATEAQRGAPISMPVPRTAPTPAPVLPPGPVTTPGAPGSKHLTPAAKPLISAARLSVCVEAKAAPETQTDAATVAAEATPVLSRLPVGSSESPSPLCHT